MSDSHEERLLLAMLARFEAEGLACYHEHAPHLATDAKSTLLDRLRDEGADDDELSGSELWGPVGSVLRTARSSGPTETLFVQGLLLEILGCTIYTAAAKAPMISDTGKQLAAQAIPACRAVVAMATTALVETVGTGEPAFVEFADATHDVIAALDPIGEPVDAVFGERFDIRYSELIGDFTADLVAVCADLDMPRRKVLAHLAGASMGF